MKLTRIYLGISILLLLVWIVDICFPFMPGDSINILKFEIFGISFSPQNIRDFILCGFIVFIIFSKIEYSKYRKDKADRKHWEAIIDNSNKQLKSVIEVQNEHLETISNNLEKKK